MEFKEVAPKYFWFLEENGFSRCSYHRRGMVEEYTYEAQSYGLRVSHDMRDRMVSVYLFSKIYKDLRFKDRFQEVNIWTFLKQTVEGGPLAFKSSKEGIEGELESAASLVLSNLRVIQTNVVQFFDARNK